MSDDFAVASSPDFAQVKLMQPIELPKTDVAVSIDFG